MAKKQPAQQSKTTAMTTLALGEENVLTTMALGEEVPITTLAIGEECPYTRTQGEDPTTLTTLMLGEEGGGTLKATTGTLTTLIVGEESLTTDALGEEDPAALAAEQKAEFTTLAIGEEGAPSSKNVTTKKIGEETLTTLVVGEEGSPPKTLELKNPFGAF